MKDREAWDSSAARAISEAHSRQPYVAWVHLRAAEMALRYADAGRLCVLKSDLWNEGIEVDRDILGMLEHQSRLSLFGVEISGFVSNRAKTRLKKTHVIQGDIRSIPLKNGSFDVLFDFSTIDHFEPDQIHIVIKEYQRVLKKSGVMLMSFWYPACFPKTIGILRRVARVPYPQYFLDTKRMKALIGEVFEILDEYYAVGWGLTVSPRMKGAETRFFSIIHDLIIRFELSKFSKFLLKDVAGVLIIVARKRRDSP
jgi:SAM-dependent methyltransferase